MSANFDFNSVGKRMPYRLPDGALDTVEDRVMQEISRQPLATTVQPVVAPKKRHLLRNFSLVASIAAAVVVGFIALSPNTNSPAAQQEQVTDIAQVEQAFNELSTEDQEYLVSVYEDDVFMDEVINSQTTEEQ